MRKSKKPLTALLSFGDHLIFGAVTATLVSKLGDDSLFPSNKQADKNYQDEATIQHQLRNNTLHVIPQPSLEERQYYVMD